jgi:hypothetical protein
MALGLSWGTGSSKQGTTTSAIEKLRSSETQRRQSEQDITGSGTSEQSFWTPEQQSLAAHLSGYLGGTMGGAPSAWQQAGTSAMQRAATGQGYSNIIDPKASNELYASIERQTLEDILPKATQALAGQANMAGMLRSGPALQMQMEQRDQIVNELAKTLAGLKYQDETQRRDIEREREGRQLPAAQAMTQTDPNQAAINNIMQMLGIRGTATEATQTQQHGETMDQVLQRIWRSMFDRSYGSSRSSNQSLGFSGSVI